MKFIFVLFLLYFNSGVLLSQTYEVSDDPPLLYIFTDKLPKFNYDGGLDKYVYSNLNWKSNVYAIGTVLISFVVDKKGNVKNIKIEKSLGEECDGAAYSVFESMPQWEPGEKDLRNVDVLMYFPIKFVIKGK